MQENVHGTETEMNLAKIQEKYPKKISKPTVINYVRSELTQKYNLNIDNSNWIIEKLENILSDET